MEESERKKIIKRKRKGKIILKKKKSFSIIKIIYFIPFILFIFFVVHKIINKTSNKNIPKVSIFLPIYNKAKYLKKTIESLQSQTLKDIEIVTVNDCSTDNSLEILKELAKKDKRIKIVDYKPNRGPLYARAMGVLNCTGEYILNLDSDDRLYGNDSLEFLYNKAKKSDLDVILYSRLIKYEDGTSQTAIRCTIFDKIIKQPELYEITFREDNTLRDFLIWNKIVKKEVYLKAYHFLEKRIYGEKWTHYDDNIWSILIHKFANSMECVNKTLYIHMLNPTSLTKKVGSLDEVKSVIDKYEMYKIIYSTEKEKKYLISEFYNLMDLVENFGNFRNLFHENENIKNWVIKTCKDFINEFQNESHYIRIAEHFLRKVSNNKIIIFKKDNIDLDIDLMYKSMLNFIKNEKNKTVVHANILDHRKIEDMKTFIYPNDTIIGLNVEFFENNWIYFDKNIINEFPNNKVLLFSSNYINDTLINSSNNIYNYKSNVVIFVNNDITLNFLKQFLNNKILTIPNIATYYDNLSLNGSEIINNDYALIFLEHSEHKTKYYKNIYNILSKYYKKIKVKNIDKMINDIINKNNINEYLREWIYKIKRYNIIITDNWHGMIISTISGTSCIIVDNINTILKSEYNKWFKDLDYISFISEYSDINIEKEINLLKNKATPNMYNKSIFNHYYDIIKDYIG